MNNGEMSKKENTVVVACSSSGLDYYHLKHDIYVLQNSVLMAGKMHAEEDLNAFKFNQWLTANPRKLPVTEPTAAGRIVDLFSDFVDAGIEQAIVILPSKHLSAMSDHFHEVMRGIEPNLDVHIFESNTFGFGETILALKAQALVRSGRGVTNILEVLKKTRQRQLSLFGLPDLKAMNRHQKFTCTACENNKKALKPLFYIDADGHVDLVDCFHGEDSLLNAIYKEVTEFSAFSLPTINIIHNADATQSKALSDKLIAMDVECVKHYPASVELATYTGRGYIGVVVEK